MFTVGSHGPTMNSLCAGNQELLELCNEFYGFDRMWMDHDSITQSKQISPVHSSSTYALLFLPAEAHAMAFLYGLTNKL